ncbi:MAG: helix-turn-helix domain-containing protein [Gemmiger sp.]
MAIEFNRIITLLRKERGITQKQAAQDLGISQAQLSHYEKGIRECGLAFVVQVADYYGVSCDYLLGRSADRNGQTIQVTDLPGTNATGGSVYRGSVLPTMYKKLIENSLDILYDKLESCQDKKVVTSVSVYLMAAVYRMFRQLFEASPKNVSSMFRVGTARWPASADAVMQMQNAELAARLTGEDGGRDALDPATLGMSTESLARDYPRHATSLLNLIKNTEESMRGLQR